MGGVISHLHRSEAHTFSKDEMATLHLIAGIGVTGDAHAGATVQHRSRVAQDPTQPNLRQVHLLPRSILDSAANAGFTVAPGDLGENVTTDGIDLHALPVGTILRLGTEVLVALTGLRNPCGQIDGFSAGLRGELRPPDETGTPRLLGGVMAVVILGGAIHRGDLIEVALPPGPPVPLERI